MWTGWGSRTFFCCWNCASCSPWIISFYIHNGLKRESPVITCGLWESKVRLGEEKWLIKRHTARKGQSQEINCTTLNSKAYTFYNYQMPDKWGGAPPPPFAWTRWALFRKYKEKKKRLIQVLKMNVITNQVSGTSNVTGTKKKKNQEIIYFRENTN